MEKESTMPPEISGVVSVISRSSLLFQVFPDLCNRELLW